MYEQRCRIKDLMLTPKGECALTVVLPHSFLNHYDEYREEDLNLKLSKYRNKRSKDSNAYFWELCGKLAAKLKTPPREIYRALIKDIGGNYEIVPIKDEAVEEWTRLWELRGIGWVCNVIGRSKIPGYTNVVNYWGSSEYDSTQMHRLLELVIQECKAQGIETATPEELALYEGGGV